jgi:hypothetical protein
MQEQHGEGQEYAGSALYAEDKLTGCNDWLGHTCRLVQIYNEYYVSNYSAGVIYKLLRAPHLEVKYISVN